MTATGGREACAGEEKDTFEVLASPSFYFANFGRQQQWVLLVRRLAFGYEERTKVGETSVSGERKEFFYWPKRMRVTGATYILEKQSPMCHG
jgi:transglutaminase-like putative cysteine protease